MKYPLFYKKKLSNSLCLPLALIFQKSFNNSDLPDGWSEPM